MTGRILSLLAVAAIGCGDGSTRLRPIIDVPSPDSRAYPYNGNVGNLTLSIARAGDEDDLQSATFGSGESLGLSGVSFAAELVVHLSGTTRYGRTCALQGSETEAPTPSEPHLYFSLTQQWGKLDLLNAPSQSGGYAYSSPNGAAIFLHGGNSVRFDPHAGAFDDSVLITEADRVGGRLATFGNGDALLIGGTAGGSFVSDAAVIPADGPTAQIETIQYDQGEPAPELTGHRAVSTADGRVLVAGGRGPTGVTDVAYLFGRDAGGALTGKAPHPNSLITARERHSMTRLGDEVGSDILIVGGIDDGGAAVTSVELFRPMTGTFEQVPGASLSRWDHTAVRLRGGFVLIIGGREPGGGPEGQLTRSLHLYDPSLGRFTTVGQTLTGSVGLTEMTVTLIPDGRVLMAGGLDEAGQPVADSHLFRLDTNGSVVDVSVSDAQPLSAPRAGHSAVLLCDGTVLVVGGGADVAERYNPLPDERR